MTTATHEHRIVTCPQTRRLQAKYPGLAQLEATETKWCPSCPLNDAHDADDPVFDWRDFHADAMAVVTEAQAMAVAEGASSIGTTHLARALFDSPEGILQEAAGAKGDALREALEMKLDTPGQAVHADELAYSALAKTALEHAAMFARNLGDGTVRPAHIARALFSWRDEELNGALGQARIRRKTIRARIEAIAGPAAGA